MDVIIFAVMLAIIGLAALWNYNVRQKERLLLLESMAARAISSGTQLYFVGQCLAKSSPARRHLILHTAFLEWCKVSGRKPTDKLYIRFLEERAQWK